MIITIHFHADDLAGNVRTVSVTVIKTGAGPGIPGYNPLLIALIIGSLSLVGIIFFRKKSKSKF